MTGIIAETLKILRETIPKKTISAEYIEMIKVALDFSEAELGDLVKNAAKIRRKTSFDHQKNFLQKRFDYHLQNQITMYKHKR